MGTKKGAKKIDKRSIAGKNAPAKITLPAFGLAEDILGTFGQPPADENDSWLQAAPGESGAESGLPAVSETQVDRTERDFHLVTFHLAAEEFGIAIERVQEIIRVGQITGVPNAPEFISGVINLRGRIIPVLDLRKRLSLPEAAITKSSRIMVVETGNKVLGLLVDRVSQVLRLPHASVDAPPEDIDASLGFVRGIGKIDSRLVMIMELDRVLAKDARQASQLVLQKDA
jgi:purine-binding chemotaxis protein CheW